MTITLPDRSTYFRGLLLLISKDRTIAGPERELMMRIGKALDFEREFCEKAIDEILHNPHITHEPSLFSSAEIARKFVRDGLTLALADGDIHQNEVAWLRATAEANGLDAAWFEDEMRSGRPNTADLEVHHLSVG